MQKGDPKKAFEGDGHLFESFICELLCCNNTSQEFNSLILYVKGLFGTHKIICTRETITSEEKCKVLKSTLVD